MKLYYKAMDYYQLPALPEQEQFNKEEFIQIPKLVITNCQDLRTDLSLKMQDGINDIGRDRGFSTSFLGDSVFGPVFKGSYCL